MRLSKNQISNVLWILAIVLIVFTPVGFHLKVFIGKFFAASAVIVEADEQKILEDYDWKLVSLNGNQMDFQSSKGEVLLVNFWATWCPPCVAELPSLEKLYADYGDKVKFVLVTNEQPEKVSHFVQKKSYTVPIYFERSSTPDMFFSKSIPATYIISKSGKIVVDEKGAANWNSKSTRNLLDKLLQE
ncbi:TlpA family protein disulfide reductase [Flagellimonas pacifica]|uniref:Thiol-disulfide isomerase or thioredoxin n=1 Tax=Flagellimonas pacifica TaxID=1247520 RepID=A0A285MXY7_9FLAO|nr:TlpA disulfide reductase family protein [Allomuricauda parva]SNZ02055.1 Thiol-disulfide isomerase or thioredoxin [Allomuricauda parva]